MTAWRAGDHAVLRDIYRGKVAYVRPVTVVHDRTDEVALYLAAGTPCKTVRGLEPLARGEWECVDRVQTRTNVLMLLEPDAWYSVWLMWNCDTGELWQWYVNFQSPFARSAIGFDTADKTLDITVDPQRNWQWKDEEEFEYAQRLGLIDSAEAERVRAAARDAIERIENARYPFTDEWLSWGPDPDWGLPAIPRDWHVVGARSLIHP